MKSTPRSSNVGDSVSFLQSATADLAKLRGEYRDSIDRLVAHEPPEEIVRALKQLESSLDLKFLSHEIPKAFERTLEGVECVAAIVRAMKEFAHPDAAQHSDADLNHAIQTTLTVARKRVQIPCSDRDPFRGIAAGLLQRRGIEPGLSQHHRQCRARPGRVWQGCVHRAHHHYNRRSG